MIIIDLKDASPTTLGMNLANAQNTFLKCNIHS